MSDNKKLTIFDVTKFEFLNDYVPKDYTLDEYIRIEIGYILDRIDTFFRNIQIGIKNIFKYLPIIWNDRDWDYEYCVKLLRFKLKNMSKYLKEEDILFEVDRICGEIDTTVEHIDNWLNAYDIYENDNQELLKQLRDEHDPCEYDKLNREYYTKCYEFEEEQWSKIWSSINKKMQGWWS